MRYLAVDYGVARTGLAVCDADETIASPLDVLRGPKNLTEKLVHRVETEGIEAIVIGLPLNMDGSEGPQAKRVRTFAERLNARIHIPIYFQDERLSSFEAGKKLQTTGLTRAKRRDRLDAVAAAEILQAFLDNKRQH